MSERSPAVVGLMRKVLLHESGGAREGESLARGTEATLEKLSHELEVLVGAHGLAALAGRALSLARREFDFLAGVRLAEDGGFSLTGLRDALAARPVEAEAACLSLTSHLAGLLVGLVGEELGLTPVQRAWPGLFHDTDWRDAEGTE